MEEWKRLKNKTVKVVYKDGVDHYSKKVGELIEIAPTHLVLDLQFQVIALNLNEIIRVEEVRNA